MTKTLYTVSEFARRAGVTVRTLHHYDRVKLLVPSGRSASGYRLYRDRDMARLQQIVTLKFIGLPLGRIRELLDRSPLDLAARLRRQREVLEERRRQLDLAVEALEQAERAAAAGVADPDAFAHVIEVIEMTKNMDWIKKYYTEEQLEELASRSDPEANAQAERDWKELFRDVEAARDEDPASPRAQALVDRWDELVFRFTQGNPGIAASLESLYADRGNWPSSFENPVPTEAAAFIEKARQARKEASNE